MIPHRCVFCLAGNGAEVRFDKKGRPYTTCRSCGTRAFFPSIHAMRGLAVVPQLLEEALRRREADEKYREWFDAQIAGLVQTVTTTAISPGPAARDDLHRPLVVPFDQQEKTA
ncbi:MAG: hypothetical protein Q8S13_06420 [Dehalococcoidia bacterium]|nr:hypothetical protein [Dehalococcoidia bacterium]